jgi:hypothetical protein
MPTHPVVEELLRMAHDRGHQFGDLASDRLPDWLLRGTCDQCDGMLMVDFLTGTITGRAITVDCPKSHRPVAGR